MKKRTRALFLKVITFFQIFSLTFQPLSLLSVFVLDPVVARAQGEAVVEEQVIAEPVVEANVQAEPAAADDAEEIIEHEDSDEDLIDVEEDLEGTPEENSPVVNEEEPSEDEASDEADPELSIPEPTLTLMPTPMPTVAIAEEAQELASTCLSPEQEVDVTYSNWSVDQEEDSAQSIDKVQLGVEYAFPLDPAVSVSFTCLPEKVEDRSAIKIQRVLVSDLNLPDSVQTNALYAYDITTDMSNGSFKYDLTLPKPEGVEAEVVYIEESIEKVKEGVESEDIKVVKEEKIDQKKNSVEVEGLDHFTIYIVSTTVKISGQVNGSDQVTVMPGATITVTMEVQLSDNEPNDWNSSRYQIEGGSSTCVDTPNHTDTGTHSESFDIIAPTTPGTYDLTLRAYDQSNCSGNESTRDEKVMQNAIIVQIPSNPVLPTQACGLDIALVLDVSGSIDNTELRQMKDAFKAFVDALSGTPTQFSVTKFDTTATVLQQFTSDYTAVKDAIESADGSGWTNWEDGLNKAWSTYDPRTDKPNLIIFSSDGNPNRNGANGTSVSEAQAVASAVGVANTIKGAGTRILALGIGTDLNTGNMIAISGTNVNTGILTSDVITSDFSTLATDLGELASKTCGGTITVKKYIDSISTPGGAGWKYTVLGATTKYLETGTDGTANTGKITAGTYSVAETYIPSGYSYGSAVCKNQAEETVGSIITNGMGSITVSDEDIISCDFINTTNKGSITIVKDAQPNHAQDFAFTTTGSGLSGFSLDDDDDNTLSNTKVFSNLTPGEFTVTEGTVSDWNLKSISCDTGETVDLNNRKVTINLTPGENVTCTFVNTLSTGNIIVDKVTEPAGDTTSFSFTTTGSGYNGFSLKDTDSPNNQQLTAGTYSVSETSLSGWTKKSAVCVSSIGDTETPGNLELDAGETITCTFTNTKKGNLIVQKTTYPSGDSTNFTILASGTGTITGGGSGTISDSVDKTYEVTPGTYSVGETVPSGWRLLSNNCTNIVVGAGETKYCTIVNQKYSKITIVKEALPESSQLFTFTTTGLSSFQLKDDGASSNSIVFQALLPGTYTVKETVPDGWNLTNLVCTDPTGNSGANPTVANQADINLAAGEEVICTFTNTKYNPQIEVVKSSETTEITAAGQKVPYTFTVTNTGDQTLTGITVSDPKCDATPAYQSGDTNSDSKLQTNETWVYTCSHTVTQAEIDAGGNLSNTVTVDSNESEENTDNFDIPVTQNPALTIVKTATPSTYDKVGDVISYEFKVKNTGNVTLYGISVVDDKATDESCPDTSGGLAPQGEITCTASYTITLDDLDAESVTNVASAQGYFGETPVISPEDTETVTSTAGKITVYKYYDVNRDGVKNRDEITLADWEMVMSSDEEEDSIKQSTADSGSTLFYLPAGDWQLSETMQEDWEQTGIYCKYAGEGELISLPGEEYGCHGNCYGWNNCGDAATCALWACNINGYANLVSYGQDYPCTQLNNCHLFNYGPGSIQWNWGNWCAVSGVTDIYCSNGDGVAQRLVGYDSRGDVYQNNAYNLTVNPGDKKLCYVGNALNSQLMIEKSNDAWPNDQEIGDEVTYTIKLMATDGPVYDVSLFDLPPNAFSYVGGSYMANSSIAGDLSLSEPNYASPGEWQLGDLAKDEIVTVSYKAIIGDEADAGIYPDAAWATGTSAEARYFEEEADLLALSDPDFKAENGEVAFLGDQGHYGEEHFVGTRVAVVTDETPSAKYKVEKIKEKEGEVLGAVLPATGANFWLSLLAIISILTGTGLLLVPNRKRRQGKVLMMLLMLGLGLLMAKPVQALTSVRLAQPYNSSAELDQDAITNQDEFRIDFVILNTDGAILTAQCQQQEDGGAWTNIDTVYTVKAGGNSGYCEAKDLANSSQYAFRVLTSDGEEGQSVKVGLETDRPKKPVSYEKNQISSCKYEIKFKTADDGRTSKVEVYRSDDSVSFTAKASSRIKTISIGSDEKHSFETTRPDCDKDYYYAIRAFDQYGNASDLVGDREVKTIIVEGTAEAEEATGALEVTEIVILDGDVGDDGVLSEGLLGEEVAEDEKGTILGIETESLVSFLTKVLLPILVFVTIAILVYRLVIAKRNEK